MLQSVSTRLTGPGVLTAAWAGFALPGFRAARIAATAEGAAAAGPATPVADRPAPSYGPAAGTGPVPAGQTTAPAGDQTAEQPNQPVPREGVGV
jgi:hypothetical protein